MIQDSYNYSVPMRDQRFNKLSEKEEQEDGPRLTLTRMISNYDKKFLEYLVHMHNVLRSDKVDINQFANVFEALSHMKNEQGNEYLKALARPEESKGSKIPSQIPIPSSSFQLHSSIMVAPNASGNAAILFNPVYLATTGTTSTFWLNNAPTLTGTASNNLWTAQNIQQTIPPVYNQYRIVSASVVVKYVGRLDIVQGVVGGAIVFDQNIGAFDYTSATVTQPDFAKYGDFNLAMDAFYTQENLTLNGLRELYFPLDNSYEEYLNVNTAKKGFGFLIYILGGVPTNASYKVDVYVNYECLPDSAFLNYIPTTLCQNTSENKEEAVRFVQKKPITMENERKSVKQTTFWKNVIDSMGEYIPALTSVAKLILPLTNAIK